jgi:hypothetical protein
MRVFIAMSSQAFAQMVRRFPFLLPSNTEMGRSTEWDQHRLLLCTSGIRASGLYTVALILCRADDFDRDLSGEMLS